MDGCDEDEHNEGAHQVGLEDLIPHLGVLHREKKTKKEEAEEDVRVRWRNACFQTNKEGTTHERHFTLTRATATDACMFNHKR